MISIFAADEKGNAQVTGVDAIDGLHGFGSGPFFFVPLLR
jgi:hypothetical protein